MVKIKPIQTEFNGYRFRSRLEARWAVFFKTMNIKYIYEHEGFDLGQAGWYLPDFYLPEYDYQVEIKPTDDVPSDEIEKVRSLAKERTDGSVYILHGVPGLPDGYDGEYYATALFQTGEDYPYFWCECPECGSVDLQFDGRSARNTHKPSCEIKRLHRLGKDHPVYGRTDDKIYNYDSPNLVEAFNRAKRFDFKRGQVT